MISCQGTFWLPPNQRTNVENFPNNGKTIKNHGLSLCRTTSQSQESIGTDCLHLVQRRPDTWLECHGTPMPAVTRPPPSSWPEALTSGRERQKYFIEKYSPQTNKQPTKKNALTLSKHPCHVRFFEIFSWSTLPTSHEGRRSPIQVLQYPTLLVFREMAPFAAISPFLFDPFSNLWYYSLGPLPHTV